MTDREVQVHVDETSLGHMLHVAGPMIVATVSYTLMQFVDRLMVAYHSETELAAVLPASIVSFVPSSFMLGVLTTVNTFVSQSLGRRQYRDCSHYCWQAIYIGLAYSVVTIAVVWPLAAPLFHVMQQPAAIIPLEVTYLRIMLIGQFVVVFIWATNQFFMGIHRPSITMVTALLSQVVNVLANYVLIFGKWGFPEMGIAGAGWGTIIGAVVNAVTRSLFFVSPSIHRQFYSRATFGVDPAKIGDLIKIGTPAGFAMCVKASLVGALLFRLIGVFGEGALAATSAVYSCTTLSFMPVVGLGIALTATVGRSIGRSRQDIAVAQTRLCLRLSLAYMGLVGLIFFFFRAPIIGFWQLSTEATALGMRLLICAAVFQVFDAAVITYSGVLRGAGDTWWLGLVTTTGAIIFLGLGGWLIVTYLPHWGAVGPWIAYTLHVIFVGLAHRRRFRGNLWQAIDLFKRQPLVMTEQEESP